MTQTSDILSGKLKGSGYFISKKIGKAIEDFDLIKKGDRILIAVSGGKDSTALLALLAKRREFAPIDFYLKAVYVHSRTDSCRYPETFKTLCRKLGVESVVRRLSVDVPKKRACFVCSWHRRKILFTLAANSRCNKVALAHTKDDIVQTTLLNLFFNGEISTMVPRQRLFKGKITLIRPLAYVEEDEIRRFCKAEELPLHTCRCRFKDLSKRKLVQTMIAAAEKVNPATKTNVLRALGRIKKGYLL
jgi:tRNA(Ile)-lysidine synthase TilS/MesJ